MSRAVAAATTTAITVRGIFASAIDEAFVMAIIEEEEEADDRGGLRRARPAEGQCGRPGGSSENCNAL